MTDTTERQEKLSPGLRHDLKASMADGAGFSLMVAFGESYFPAFVLAIGLSEVTAGLIITVPLLVGAVLQMISPVAVYWLNSHKRWVVAAATVQALSFIPLVGAALVGRIPAAAMYLMASIYWAMGMAAGPAWSAWVDSIVPKPLRTRFFARRNRMMQLLSLSGFVAGGYYLQSGHRNERTMLTFAAFFAIAGFCRFVSARFLAAQTEKPAVSPIRIVPPQDIVKRLRHRRDGRLLFYLLCVQFTAFISAPYFSPYMLMDLKLPYGSYALLVGTSTFAKIVMLGFADRLARRFGIKNLLVGAGIAIVPLPALWMLTSNYSWLMVFQFLGGASWGMFELMSFLMLFEAIPQHERTSILTVYNLANATAVVTGSLIGGAILNPAVIGAQGDYHQVFAVSTLARAATIYFLLRVIKAHAEMPQAGTLPAEYTSDSDEQKSERQRNDRAAS